ncbi:NB-ARC domain-containing protein [Streptomyces sp. NRRL F-5123]|uniref:NB-ARC domain-containing protein n=1 Tax=Streptomyces sp. NRRL F-5123 TaxID=1463856 RepID=UPI0004E0B8A0|nr:NB-ARC domain-containing protein [Streptomyces sp. NRRL F-5123]
MDELASLMGPGAAALATLVVTDAVNGFKSLMRRVLPHAAGTADDDQVLPGELAEAVEDAAAAHALGDRAAARAAAAALEEALVAQLRDVLRQRPEAADEVRGVLADAVAARAAAPAARPAVPQPAALQVPVLLPRITVRPQRHFQNHEDLLAAMDAAVAGSRAYGGPAYLYLTGIPGIGKRALLHRWLGRSAAGLTGPQLEASLARDAWGNTPAPASVLERWLRRLGVPREDVPAEADDRLTLLADTLRDRRAVLLLTDVVTPAQVRALVPAGLDDATVLLTSTSVLPALRSGFGAEPLAVGRLDAGHSRSLLFGVAGLDEAARSDQDKAAALKELTACCAGLPLALVSVGAQLAVGPPGRVFELADALSRPETRMRTFDVDDELSVSAALDPGYRALGARAAHAYRCLGLHPAPEFETDVLRAVLPELDLAARHEVLRQLGDANLVECLSGTRYAFGHPLIHAHARERALADEPAEAVDEARGRITGFYLELLERAEAALSSRYRLDPDGVYPGYAPTGPVDEQAVIAGLARRHDALCQAVRLAHESGRHEPAWRMAQALHTYFLKGRLHSDWIAVHEYAIASARETNDLTALARMHFETGFAHQDRCSVDRRDPEAARRHFDQALDVVAASGRTPTEAERRTRSSVLEARALLASKLGEPAQALELLAAAEDALGDLHHPRGRALFALHRGTVHAQAADHARAEAELLAAAAQFAALTPPNRFNQAKALTRCAEVRRAAGRTADALDALDRALAALGGMGGSYQTGGILLLRGTLHHEAGGQDRALRDWTAARGHFAEARSVRRVGETDELLARHGGAT